MTTNVFDGVARIASTDSRWSVRRDFAVFYVDDTAFEKLFIAHGHVFLFAGNAIVIQQWKDYLQDPIGLEPTLEGIAILSVNIVTCEVLFGYGQEIVLEVDGDQAAAVYFAGTGSYQAADSWKVSNCVMAAVEAAKSLDFFSGGKTIYFNLASGEGNLSNSNIGLIGLQTAFNERGMVMYTGQDSRIISINEAKKNDTRVAEFADQIASGQVALNAPCDALYNKPTEQDKERVSAALNKLFGR